GDKTIRAAGGATPARFDTDIAAAPRPVFHNKLLAEALRQPLSHQARDDVGRAARRERHDHSHQPRRIGLRPRDTRHCRQRGSARSEMQELSAGEVGELLSITSFAHLVAAGASNGSGKVRPSVFAVFALMTNSTFVTCWTGRSAGFSPLRMRPT